MIRLLVYLLLFVTVFVSVCMHTKPDREMHLHEISSSLMANINAVVPEGCIIAANSLVLSGAQLEPNSVYAGVPAKKVKEITPEQREHIVKRTARDYQLYASWYTEEE